MADQVVFRHPSGATSNTTERGAAEFARNNPGWIRLMDNDLAELVRPGIKCLLEILSAVEVTGLEGRNVEKDWDNLAAAMKVLR